MNAKQLLAVLCASALIYTPSAWAETYEYIGRAEALQTAHIRPEISARITRVNFSEGSFVKEGAVLFTLNPAKFQADLQLKKAQLSHAQAELNGAKKYLSRLRAADSRSVPASDIDTADSTVKKAQAAVEEARAQLKLSQLDLNDTKIYAPISGKTGKAEFTKGNYVSPENILVSIVQTNPARISFAMPDRDYLANKDKTAEYELTLPDGSTYQQKAQIDFVNSTMNHETGTITIWLTVPNDNNSLIPGSIVRVKVIYPSGE